MIDYSTSHIIKRSCNDGEYIHVSQLPTNAPALVVLPGELRKEPSNAISGLGYCEKLLRETNTPLVDIYSVYYKFNERVTQNDRFQMFCDAGHKLPAFPETDIKNIGYIQSLFNIVFAPRISDTKGNKYSKKQLNQKFSNLVFFCHCHGAAVLFMLQEMLESKMRELGYTKSETTNCENKIFAVMHAPVAPVEKFKFNAVSFISALDTCVMYYNHGHKYLSENINEIQPSFFTHGKTFITPHFYNPMIKRHDFIEHNIFGMDNDRIQNTTSDGKQICVMERDMLINAIRLIQHKRPVPSIEKLAKSSEINFENLKQNGDKFYKQMLINLRREQNLKHVRQR